MFATNEETLQGEVLRLTYQDPYSGFVVAKLLPQKENREVAIVGYMPFIQIGHNVELTGKWEINPRHGRQFSVMKMNFKLPQDSAAIHRLLASGFFPGIGPVRARKIVAAFGEKTFSILEQEPEKFYALSGLNKKCVDSIIKNWKQRTAMQDLFIVLTDFGLSHAMANKVLKTFGSEALQIIKTNPYRLAKEIHGIGFQIADAIAKKLGMDPLSDIRIDAALEYLLWELSSEGHTCAPLKHFIPLATEHLKATSEKIEERLKQLFVNGDITLFKPNEDQDYRAALIKLFKAEQGIAFHLSRLQRNNTSLRSFDCEKAILWAQEQLHMTFAQKQKDAIAMALQHKTCIITGGPGTGKSTITKAIITILERLTKKITLIAPTGRAAKRLSEMTHRHAKTIHRLLKYIPGSNRFEHTYENPLNSDIVIIDEASMLDTNLALALLEAIPDHAKIVFIGDVDQLPSIGPGAVLKDLILSKTMFTTVLTEIYRQAQHSKIIFNAHLINQGQMPSLNADGEDFFFIKCEEPSEIRKKVLQLVTDKIPSRFQYDPRKDIQIICPMRRGECGIDQLNCDLQAHFAPTKEKSCPFAIHDKVIQCKNNYKKDVYNGDIGYVQNIDAQTGCISVEFDDRLVLYDPINIDELSLAWAVSVHKFQGSESPVVIIPIHTQHFKLLNKNLLYTAVTRGKKIVILVGLPKAIAIAVHTENSDVRWTNLEKVLLCENLHKI
jgi:exodeoxyribonuclease V alpha subunit